MPKALARLKQLTFLGSSLDDLRDMPESVRHAIGVELMIVQLGGTPGTSNLSSRWALALMSFVSEMPQERSEPCT